MYAKITYIIVASRRYYRATSCFTGILCTLSLVLNRGGLAADECAAFRGQNGEIVSASAPFWYQYHKSMAMNQLAREIDITPINRYWWLRLLICWYGQSDPVFTHCWLMALEISCIATLFHGGRKCNMVWCWRLMRLYYVGVKWHKWHWELKSLLVLHHQAENDKQKPWYLTSHAD